MVAEQNHHTYDVLAIDAFSGDAIPVHLLTREAFAIYEQALRPDGILAVHISNRYLEPPAGRSRRRRRNWAGRCSKSIRRPAARTTRLATRGCSSPATRPSSIAPGRWRA